MRENESIPPVFHGNGRGVLSGLSDLSNTAHDDAESTPKAYQGFIQIYAPFAHKALGSCMTGQGMPPHASGDSYGRTACAATLRYAPQPVLLD